jgi:hypothetical protein
MREAYAELRGASATTLLTCTDAVYDLVVKEFCISRASSSSGATRKEDVV